MNTLISVIVPIYNVEKYIHRCIESIINQTYKNIEIILVDDGSPDQCPLICDEYVNKDSRIKVIHKENGGLSDARNAGIKIAKGEYYCFVDSDDYIKETMIEDLLMIALESKVKLVISNIMVIDESGDRVFHKEESPVLNGIFKTIDLLPKIYQTLGWYYIVVWNKLYHKSLFEDIYFPFGKIHEDEYIVAQIMWKAQKIACINKEEYIYIYQRSGGIMASRQIKSQYDWLEALYLRFKFCARINELAYIAKETRAVYFRELNNLLLNNQLKRLLSKKQKSTVISQYSDMEGKTFNEKINWIIFRISPKLDHYIIKKIRGN